MRYECFGTAAGLCNECACNALSLRYEHAFNDCIQNAFSYASTDTFNEG